MKRESNGGEVLRKKKSESGSMWEVGKGKRGGGGGGTGGEKVVGWCGLAVARELKRAAAKEVAAARFGKRRYC